MGRLDRSVEEGHQSFVDIRSQMEEVEKKVRVDEKFQSICLLEFCLDAVIIYACMFFQVHIMAAQIHSLLRDYFL